ncbi:phosphoglycerate mutase-like protein [Aureobasidium subglaciale]|nr:phosphoglycerate mutase-like protein [Aureobasidium subglaciale]
MPPTLHLVRHAEGFHNCSWHGESIHDPLLTEKGEAQCAELCKNFPYHDKIDLLMASPMKRTIQTCKLSFKPAVEKGLKIMLMPLAQESSNEPMDTGSEVSEIKNMFGDLVDEHRITDVFPHWTSNCGRFDEDPEVMIERATMLRLFVRDREEKNVVLVSHGTFAHAITGNFSREGEQLTRMWENAECRSYTFDEGEGAKIIETEESIARRPDLERKDSPQAK